MFIPYLLDVAMPPASLNDPGGLIIRIALPLVITLLQLLLGLAFRIRGQKNIRVEIITNLVVNIVFCLFGVVAGVINYILGIAVVLLTQIISFIIEGKVYSKKFDPKKKHPYLIALAMNFIALIPRIAVIFMD